MRGVLVAALAALSLMAASCIMSRLPPAERLRRSKCGACHIAPAAGSLARADLEAVLADHQRRVPLTPAERDALVAHLAAERPAPVTSSGAPPAP